jgi:hypothetical protein
MSLIGRTSQKTSSMMVILLLFSTRRSFTLSAFLSRITGCANRHHCSTGSDFPNAPQLDAQYQKDKSLGQIHTLRLLHRFNCGARGAQCYAGGKPPLPSDLRLGTATMTSLEEESGHTILHSTAHTETVVVVEQTTTPPKIRHGATAEITSWLCSACPTTVAASLTKR